jgi:hypothetical protein
MRCLARVLGHRSVGGCRAQIAESGAEVTSLSQESPAHPASLRDVLNALHDCGMRSDVRAVPRSL